MSTNAPRPLEGVRVLDISRYISGPYCGLLLADLGAEVVKVEPRGGENPRTLRPGAGQLSTYFMSYNRNKKGICLDLRHPQGPSLLRRLAERADVLLENFRPGVLAALGCGYEDLCRLNPRLVMVSVSGFGQDGPYAARPCFDGIVQAMAGMMSITGHQEGGPTLAGTFVGDYSAGLYAALGTVAALFMRERTGRGQHVDVAMLDSVFSLLMTAVPDYIVFGQVMGRAGNHDRYRVPSNAYRTQDGCVYIIAVTETQFAGLMRTIGSAGLEDDDRFRDLAARATHAHELDALIGRWTSARTTADVLRALQAESVPSAAVDTVAEAVRNPQLVHRGLILSIDHPGLGPVALPGSPIRLSASAPPARAPAPLIGQHTREIYAGWLDLSEREIEDLEAAHVI